MFSRVLTYNWPTQNCTPIMPNLATSKNGKKPKAFVQVPGKTALQQKLDSSTINPPVGNSRPRDGTNGSGPGANGNGDEGSGHRARAVAAGSPYNPDDLDHRQLLSALVAFKRGDFS